MTILILMLFLLTLKLPLHKSRGNATEMATPDSVQPLRFCTSAKTPPLIQVEAFLISTTIKFSHLKLIVSMEMLRISRQEQAPALRYSSWFSSEIQCVRCLHLVKGRLF